MKTRIVTYHLEMTDPRALRPAGAPPEELELVKAEIPCPELNRFLYTAVGAGWYWTDRLPWSHQRWLEYLDRPELETWVAYLRGTPAGYFELERQPRGAVEIAYFGLLPGFTGRGLGGHLLTAAIRRGFELGASRVWVHTCTLDHPAALGNYRARGLRVFKEVVSSKMLPAQSPGPWPGAGPAGDLGGGKRQRRGTPRAGRRQPAGGKKVKKRRRRASQKRDGRSG
jgi:ribosomal protein S18 acetylase RimI-like enzyme